MMSVIDIVIVPHLLLHLSCDLLKVLQVNLTADD